MADRRGVPDELRARLESSLPADADERVLAAAAHQQLGVVLDLIAAGRGRREAGSGMNAASSALLVADALLTEAAALAAAGDTVEDVLRELSLDDLAARARRLDRESE